MIEAPLSPLSETNFTPLSPDSPLLFEHIPSIVVTSTAPPPRLNSSIKKRCCILDQKLFERSQESSERIDCDWMKAQGVIIDEASTIDDETVELTAHQMITILHDKLLDYKHKINQLESEQKERALIESEVNEIVGTQLSNKNFIISQQRDEILSLHIQLLTMEKTNEELTRENESLRSQMNEIGVTHELKSEEQVFEKIQSVYQSMEEELYKTRKENHVLTKRLAVRGREERSKNEERANSFIVQMKYVFIHILLLGLFMIYSSTYRTS